MEKQKIIIDELREKINLPFDNLNKLSNDQLKEAVDAAIFQVRLLLLLALLLVERVFFTTVVVVVVVDDVRS